MNPDQLPALRQKASGRKKHHKKALERLAISGKADAVIRSHHDDVFDCIDCLQCANCCKTTGPLFTQHDTSRIARYLKMDSAAFEDKYLRKDEDGDMVLRALPCPFLNDDNTCRVYEVRPRACREYPHTRQTGQAAIQHLTLKNAAVCPAVFDILEKISHNIR